MHEWEWWRSKSDRGNRSQFESLFEFLFLVSQGSRLVCRFQFRHSFSYYQLLYCGISTRDAVLSPARLACSLYCTLSPFVYQRVFLSLLDLREFPQLVFICLFIFSPHHQGVGQFFKNWTHDNVNLWNLKFHLKFFYIFFLETLVFLLQFWKGNRKTKSKIWKELVLS